MGQTSVGDALQAEVLQAGGHAETPVIRWNQRRRVGKKLPRQRSPATPRLPDAGTIRCAPPSPSWSPSPSGSGSDGVPVPVSVPVSVPDPAAESAPESESESESESAPESAPESA